MSDRCFSIRLAIAEPTCEFRFEAKQAVSGRRLNESPRRFARCILRDIESVPWPTLDGGKSGRI